MRNFINAVFILLTALVSSDSYSVGFPKPPEGGGGTSCIPGFNCPITNPPTTPTNVSAPSSDSDGSYVLTWTASTGWKAILFGRPTGHYQIEESKNSGSYINLGTISAEYTQYSLAGRGNGTYRYRVKACDTSSDNILCSGWGYSNSVEVNKLSAPATPSKPGDINSTSTSFSISWTKPAGTVTYYDVQEKVGSGSWATISGGQSGTSLSRSGKSNNTTYYYRVRACNQSAAYCSGYSSQNTVRVELKPSTPTAPSNINSTSTSYTVSWNKPSGTVNFYQVQERVAGGSWSTVSSNNTSTTITRSGRSNNTNYEYRIRACNSYTWSCSVYSGANSVKVRLRPSTSGAANPTTSTDTNSVTVSWSAVSGASYYDVQKRNNSGSWVTAATGVTGTSKSLSGFTDGSWDFRIRACNGYSWACSSYGVDGSSVVWRAIPSTPTAPTVPSSDGNGSYTVSWTKPSGTVSYYDLIERKNNSGSFTTVVNNTTATSAALTGKTDGAYDYQVRACNGYDWACSGYSTISSDVNVLHKPGTPSSISNPTTDIDGAVTVSWGSASGQVTEYRLERQHRSVWTQISNGSNATSKTVSGLGSGTYYFRVRACNASGCSAYKTGPLLTVRIKPSTPGAPSGPSTSIGSVTVSWSSVSGATYYDVQKRNNAGSWVTAKSGDTNTSETLSGLTDGSWDYRVRACNTYSWSCSSYSADSSNTTVRLIPSTPSKPTVSTASSTSGSFTINWTKPSGTVGHYIVQERKNAGSWSTITSSHSSTSMSVSNRATGNWDYRIGACNGYSMGVFWL